MPKNIAQLVAAFDTNGGCKAKGVFRVPGNATRMRRAAEQLRGGDGLPGNLTPHDLASLIKRELQARPAGLLHPVTPMALQLVLPTPHHSNSRHPAHPLNRASEQTEGT